MEPERKNSVPLIVGPDPLARLRGPQGHGIFDVSKFCSPPPTPPSRRHSVRDLPSDGQDPEQTELEKPSWTQTATQVMVFGFINCVVLAPVMVGFAQIIFADPFFEPYRPKLVKLVMISAFMHQIMFTALSTLPFAVGQVQDAGLIFLSAIARDVVERCVSQGAAADDIVSTTLFTLSISTVLLGVALVLTGYFRLAQLVQYLPMPVVAGYLAFIGLYCFDCGLTMMSGLDIQGPQNYLELLAWEPCRLVLPGLLLGIGMYIVTRKIRHFAVLPIIMLVIPTCFYIIVFSTGNTLQTAREDGWLDMDTSTIKFWSVWDLLKPSGVYWGVMVHQFPSWLGMYFVVAFSSSLDVAAIQVDLGTPLDYNHELKTVGYSNIVSGLSFGFTGSYIFSQTIFTMRTGIRSRAIGIVIIIAEMCVVILPVSVLAYVPALFFGSIMSFIGIDLMIDWLIESRHKFAMAEFVLAWLTFLAICFTNLELGMLIGIGLTAFFFVIRYAGTGANVRLVTARSAVLRPTKHRQLLAAQKGKIKALKVSGHIFFGSALGVLNAVSKLLPGWEGAANPRPFDQPVEASMDTIVISDEAADSLVGRGEVASNTPQAVTPLYVIMDMTEVSGLDATAVSTCFQPLLQLAVERQTLLVLVTKSVEVLDLLQRQGVLPHEGEEVSPDSESARDATQSPVMKFAVFEDACEWCEEQIINDSSRIGDLMSPGAGSSKRGIVTPASSLHQVTGLAEFADVETYFEVEPYNTGAALFEFGEPSNDLWIVNRGTLEIKGDSEVRVLRVSRGGFVGDLDFLLDRPRTLTVVCVEGAELWRLRRSSFQRLIKEKPELAVPFLQALCQGLALAADVVLDLDRVSIA